MSIRDDWRATRDASAIEEEEIPDDDAPAPWWTAWAEGNAIIHALAGMICGTVALTVLAQLARLW